MTHGDIIVIRYLYGEACGVMRVSLVQVSVGSKNGSASSLVPEHTLSPPSSEVTEPTAEILCVCVHKDVHMIAEENCHIWAHLVDFFHLFKTSLKF